MRKLFMGSIALLTFSLAIIVFQISCSREAFADNGGDDGPNKGKLVLYMVQNTQVAHGRSLWLMNSDGTDRRQVNIVLPGDEYDISEGGRLVDGGKKIIFVAAKANESEQIAIVYKCDLNGSGLTELFRGESFVENFNIEDSY
jgi:hypothetical protein